MFGKTKQPDNTSHWIRHEHILRSDHYECARCHVKKDRPTNACPNCGAVMKSTKSDPQWVDELEMFDAILGD